MTARAPVTILTGASAGIGWELARVFAGHGHRLVLIARRAERLAQLADELMRAGAPAPVTLALDLEQPGMADRVAAELESRNLVAQFVVNNAGFGLFGRAQEHDRAEQLRMLDLNVRTLTDFSLHYVDDLVRGRGGILNVASVAGFLPGPGAAVYYASKAYVLSFTEALHRELRGTGVRVTALCPGPVPTEFQARAGLKPVSGSPLTVAARRVAEEGYRGLMAGKRLVVPGLANKIITLLPRLLPRALMLEAVDRTQSRR